MKARDRIRVVEDVLRPSVIGPRLYAKGGTEGVVMMVVTLPSHTFAQVLLDGEGDWKTRAKNLRLTSLERV